MKPYFVKAPRLIKILFYNWTWSFTKKEKVLYLTFDDGPTPEVTEWTLNELQKHNAKATFFCIGKNIEANPSIFKKVIDQGHSVGNHTYNHLKGWKTPTEIYIKNTLQTEQLILEKSGKKPRWFRPPYGQITFKQSRKLRKIGYKIVMWDVLSADFDKNISQQKCLENVLKNTTSGSVIVFHDSVKASENMQFVLPKILEYYSSKNYKFKVLPE